MVILRFARIEDALAVAGMHVRSWQVAYRGLIADAYLDALRPEERAAAYDFAQHGPQVPRTIVAVDDDAIRAFATFGVSTDASTHDVGELMAIYVDPDRWGSGLGRSLIRRVREELRRTGFVRAVLWVLAGNVRAERFYERDGWVRTGDRRSQRIWGVDVDEERYDRVLT